jgi:hypothetical protein
MAKHGNPVRKLSDVQIADRLQSMLINAATGRRSIGDDAQYPDLRRELMRRPLEVPSFLLTHPSMDSFTASINGVPNRAEREERIRNDFYPLLRSLGQDAGVAVDSSAWTGEPSRATRLKTVSALLPLAQTSVESMIATLEAPNANGAPILNERREAIENLRGLHRSLGELLSAIDAGHFDDALGQNLQAEAARFAKRAARSLRDDPMPYLSSALLLGVLTACGFPGVGGYLTGVALNLRKHTGATA